MESILDSDKNKDTQINVCCDVNMHFMHLSETEQKVNST